MIEPGVYPASVTPFDANGEVDLVSFHRLLAWFKTSGCKGVVVAGTNGEGQYLSAIEKRDLAREAVRLGDGMAVILGLATQSLSEAKWLASQAAKAGCAATLAMAPGFGSASLAGVYDWYVRLADESAIPVLVYHHPAATRVDLGKDRLLRLMEHPNVAGLKWSSGTTDDIAWKHAMPAGKIALIGDETLLLRARQAGWEGSISGASNVLAPWIVRLCQTVDPVIDELLQPLLAAVRASPQPATHKSVLHARGILAGGLPRLPLMPSSGDAVEAAITARLGAQ